MAVYGFGPFVLDAAERKLMRDGQRIAVSGKTFDVLRLLLEAGGRLVERDAFTQKLWPGVTVEERNLTVHISTLRKALNGAAGGGNCIETVAKAGYRLSLPVRLLGPPEPAANDAAPTGLQLIKAEARANLHRMHRVHAIKAVSLFERGLTIDPNDAECHAGLASTWFLMASTTVGRPVPVIEATQAARQSALRALLLDENNGEARTVLGRLKMVYEWDWPGAEVELVRAVAGDPRSADAALAMGLYQLAVGRHGEALPMLERARQLDPLRRDTLEYLSMGCWIAGQVERALAVLTDAIAGDPAARRARFCRMVVFDHIGRHNDAMADRLAWLELYELAPLAARLSDLARRRGYREAMLEWIGFLEQHGQWYESAFERMVIGDGAQAVSALERAVDQRIDFVVYMNQHPSFRPLRGDPRFQHLIRTIGLAETQASSQLAG
jgi:DNA-binding winged helix-turn-helix (wHTH) protein/tetratricopeptide (TPR) repeat protein